MAKGKKHFVVLGLGTFGGALATKLADNGCRVTVYLTPSEDVAPGAREYFKSDDA